MTTAVSSPWWARPGLAIRDGRLFVGGVDAEALARAHGTPLFAYDLPRFAENAGRLQSARRAGLASASFAPRRAAGQVLPSSVDRPAAIVGGRSTLPPGEVLHAWPRLPRGSQLHRHERVGARPRRARGGDRPPQPRRGQPVERWAGVRPTVSGPHRPGGAPATTSLIRRHEVRSTPSARDAPRGRPPPQLTITVHPRQLGLADARGLRGITARPSWSASARQAVGSPRSTRRWLDSAREWSARSTSMRTPPRSLGTRAAGVVSSSLGQPAKDARPAHQSP
jgi:hypothetical protein